MAKNIHGEKLGQRGPENWFGSAAVRAISGSAKVRADVAGAADGSAVGDAQPVRKAHAVLVLSVLLILVVAVLYQVAKRSDVIPMRAVEVPAHGLV